VPETVERCVKSVRPDLRHNYSEASRLLDPGIPGEIFDLYEGMCQEAGWRAPRGGGVLDEMPYRGSESDQRVKQLEQQVAQLRAEGEARGAEIDRLRTDLRTRDERIACCLTELEELHRNQAAIHASTSWRVTAPLRAAFGWVGGLVHGPGGG
jgi:hypothetical protein